MDRNNRTGSHLFFIEFIIVLFFFLIVSTVCLRLFARAHGITQQADALSHAQAAAASVAAVVEDILADETDNMITLQSAAECLPGAALATLPENSSGQEGLSIFYDKDFQPCTADEARYLLTATLESANGPDRQGESAGQDEQSEPSEQNEQIGLIEQNEQSNPADQSKSVETLFISVTDYDHAPVYELSVALYRPMTRKEALQ